MLPLLNWLSFSCPISFLSYCISSGRKYFCFSKKLKTMMNYLGCFPYLVFQHSFYCDFCSHIFSLQDHFAYWLSVFHNFVLFLGCKRSEFCCLYCLSFVKVPFFFFPPVSLIWVSVFLYLRGGTSMLIGNSVPMGRGSPLARVIRCGCDIFIAQNSAVPCPGLYILGC